MQYCYWNKQCPYAVYYMSGSPAELLYDNKRTHRDIERVLPMIYQNSANEINQAIDLGISPNLMMYLIREMVEYIDRNYDIYNKSAAYNITQAGEGIKTELYWIFNILRIYEVPFEIQMDLLNDVVITSIRNLRLRTGV